MLSTLAFLAKYFMTVSQLKSKANFHTVKEPVDFEKFCTFYIEHSEHPDVEEFFRRWVYTNEFVDEL
jgi:hypothetical protein